jgi:hypothetical protein
VKNKVGFVVNSLARIGGSLAENQTVLVKVFVMTVPRNGNEKIMLVVAK